MHLLVRILILKGWVCLLNSDFYLSKMWDMIWYWVGDHLNILIFASD